MATETITKTIGVVVAICFVAAIFFKDVEYIRNILI